MAIEDYEHCKLFSYAERRRQGRRSSAVAAKAKGVHSRKGQHFVGLQLLNRNVVFSC